MAFGLIIIGSEILTGKRRDGHMAKAIEHLGARGLELDWCHILGDSPAAITKMLRTTLAGSDIVLCFGGIGATPDDHTRHCAALAAGVRLVRHPQAAAFIEARFGADAYPQRIRMADLPRDCRLIPNPVNRIAGFSIGDHHFVPGFPQMGWPMMEWVLDTYYSARFQPLATHETLITLEGTSEGQIIGIMNNFVERFPSLRLSCLPHMQGEYRETELGVRGTGHDVTSAIAWLTGALDEAGFAWRQGGQRG